MKKMGFFIWAVLMTSLVICGSAYSQEEMVVVSSDVFEDPQRPAAVFRHDEHNEAAEIEECNECHHVYDEDGKLVEDESSEDQRCADCHELKTSGRQLGADQLSSSSTYHSLFPKPGSAHSPHRSPENHPKPK